MKDIDPLYIRKSTAGHKRHFMKSPLFLLSPEESYRSSNYDSKSDDGDHDDIHGKPKKENAISNRGNDKLVSSIPLYETMQKHKKYLQPSSHALYVRLIYVQHLFFQANQAFRNVDTEQSTLKVHAEQQIKQIELSNDLKFQRAMNDWYSEQMEERMDRVHQLIEALNEENQKDKKKIHQKHREEILSLQHEIAYLQQKLRHKPAWNQPITPNSKSIIPQTPPLSPPTPEMYKTPPTVSRSPMVVKQGVQRKRAMGFSQSNRIRRNLTFESDNLLSSPEVFHITGMMKPT